ncbi:MAG: hypothetical protein P4L40_15215 [Terracidiphilus sp.]|nr:hypothetical protein [Terracidiphilus sp.]
MESLQSIELLYTADGYLYLPGDVARRFFPGDTLVIMPKGRELLLLPTRGPAAAGLLLKQHNSAGDRSVLAASHLPADVVHGRWPCFWDERSGALRVACYAQLAPRPPFANEPAIAAKAVVECEYGRWIVYLELAFSAPGSSDIRVERHCMGDYSTETRAASAARWIERSAELDRGIPHMSF